MGNMAMSATLPVITVLIPTQLENLHVTMLMVTVNMDVSVASVDQNVSREVQLIFMK